VGSANACVAVEGRDSPSFAANHRRVASCRFLSQFVVIGPLECRLRHKANNFCSLPSRSPVAVSIFIGGGLRANSRGSRPKVSCPEGAPPFPYKIWGAFLDGRHREALDPKWPRRQNSCPESPSAIPLYVERQFASKWNALPGDLKILPSRTPLAISFISEQVPSWIVPYREAQAENGGASKFRLHKPLPRP